MTDASRAPHRMRPEIAAAGEESFVEGRRSYIRYRDLGVSSASGGRFGGTVHRAVSGPVPSTGWHYHVCEAQLTYVLRGSAEIEFGDGTVRRISAGDAVFIPGGVRHIERDATDDIEVIEYTVPAEIGTVECDGPGPDVDVGATRLSG